MIDLTKGKDSIYPFSFTEIDKVFDDETFKRRDFYRLQRLEDLYNERKISNELRWTEI